MTFNDTTNKDGLIQDCEFWLFAGTSQITSDTNLLKTFTGLMNRALDSTVTTILESDDRWDYDDTTYTDYPIATTNIVKDQRDYVLSVSHLKVTRVEIKDEQGIWRKLQPIDLVDVPVARDEYLKDGGIPMVYDKTANSIFLYPTPNYNASSGLRVYYQREPNYFTSSDTTKAPGFVTILHRIVSMKASYDFAIANNLTDKIRVLADEITKKTDELKRFYQRRNKDEKLKVTARATRSK